MEITAMTVTSEPTLIRFEASHIPQAVALSRAENWPHRADDWALIQGLSHGVVALAEGEVAGTAMATVFGDVGMLNMIIVGARLRGRGLGRRLMQQAMALAQPQEWRLVATQDGLPLYRKLGFIETGEIVQCQGVLAPVAAPVGIDWARPADLTELAALDQAATGADRHALLAAIMAAGQIAVLRRNDRIRGYAARRAFGRGEVVGPVIARDVDAAKALLSHLFADRAGAFMRVDIPQDCGLEPWLKALGLARAGRGIAMSRGSIAPRASEFKRFALAAQALG